MAGEDFFSYLDEAPAAPVTSRVAPPPARDEQSPFDFVEPDPAYVDQLRPKPEAPTWGDYGQAIVGGVGSTISSTGAGLQYFTGMGDQLVAYGKGVSKAAFEKMTPGGQQAVSDSIWSPKGSRASALGIQAVGAIPSVASTLGAGLTAAVAAPAVGLGATGAGIAGFAAGAGMGALQGAGQVYDDIREGLDKMPDAELQAASTRYRELRASGEDEKAARAALLKDAAGYKPALSAAVTAITSKFGIEGMVANRIAGNVLATGLLKGFLKGAAGEGFQEAIENGAQEYLTQQGAIDAKDGKGAIDWAEIGDKAFSGGAVGALLGGGTGAVLHSRPRKVDGHVDPDQQIALQGALAGGPAPTGPAPPTAQPAAPSAPAAPATPARGAGASNPDEEEEGFDPTDNSSPTSDAMRAALRDNGPGGLTATAPPPPPKTRAKKGDGGPGPIQVIQRGPDEAQRAALAAASTPNELIPVDDRPETLPGAPPFPRRGPLAEPAPAPQPAPQPAPAPAPQPITPPAPQQPAPAPVPQVAAPAPTVNMDLMAQLMGQPQPVQNPVEQPAPEPVQAVEQPVATPEVAPEPVPVAPPAPAPQPAPAPAPRPPRGRQELRDVVASSLSSNPDVEHEGRQALVQQTLDQVLDEHQDSIAEAAKNAGVRAVVERAAPSVEALVRERVAKTIEQERNAAEAADLLAMAGPKTVERAGSEKGKSIKGQMEESEKAHVRYARKTIEEKGEAAPGWAKETVAIDEERKKMGPGKPNAEARSKRNMLTFKLTKAREARATEELAAGQAADETARRKALKEKREAEKTASDDKAKAAFEAHPTATTARAAETPSQMRERAKKIVAQAKANGVTAPDTFERDAPPFVNLLVLASRVARGVTGGISVHHQTGNLTYDDFLVGEMLVRAGQGDAFMEMVLKDSFLQGPSYDTVNTSTRDTERGAKLAEESFNVAPKGWEFAEPSAGADIGEAVGENIVAVETPDGGSILVTPDRQFRSGDVLRTVMREQTDAERGGVLPGGRLDINDRLMRAIRRGVAKAVQRLVGDTPLYVVTREEMDRIKKAPAGQRVQGMLDLSARHPQGHILLVDEVLHSPELQHVVLHEMLHASLVTGLYRGTENTKNVISAIARHAYRDIGGKHYAWTNNDEFLAEALSNPAFQRRLMDTPMPAALRAEVRALVRGREPTLWDALVGHVQVLLRMAGFGRLGASYLEGVMAAAPSIAHTRAQMEQTRQEVLGARTADLAFPGMVSKEDPFGVLPMMKEVEQVYEAALVRADAGGWGNSGRKFLNWAKTTAQIGRDSRERWGENGLVEQIADLFRRGGPEVRKLGREGTELVIALDRFARNNHDAAEVLSTLAHDGTQMQYDFTVPLSHASNKHIAKSGARWAQARAQHAAAHATFNSLPAEQQELLTRMRDFYRDTQNRAMTLTVQEIIASANDKKPIKLPAGETLTSIRDWVLSGKIRATDEQIAHDPRSKAIMEALGGLATQLRAATEMELVKGFYVPLMRRGNLVVSSTFKVTAPSGATLVDGNKLVFADAKTAERFLETTKLPVSVKYVWVDPQTGDIIRKMDNDNSVRRTIVTVQNRDVRFYDNARVAERERQELMKDANYDTVSAVMHRDQFMQATEVMPQHLNALLRSLDQSTASGPVKALAKGVIIDTTLRKMAGTRVQHRRIARRNVLGFSKDLVLAARDYNTSMANYIGRMQSARQAAALFEKAEEYIRLNANRGGESVITRKRQEELRELRKRYENVEDFYENNFISHLTTLSFLAHLAAPAYSLINSLQPGMVTLPYLGGKYSLGSAMRELTSAYSAIGGGSEFASGLADTGRAAKELLKGPSGRPAPNSAVRIRDRVAQQPDGALLTKAIDTLVEHGLMDADAGLELEQSEIGRGLTSVALQRVASVGRALPAHIEAINRGVTAVAAARLAKQKGMSDEQILREVRDAVEATQGDYSTRGTARLFNNPTMRVIGQFKKYPQMMAHLIGRNLMLSMKSASPEERKAAVKTLVSLGLVTLAMAGATGLPWEIPKTLMMVAWALGLADEWDQYEAELQKKLQQIMASLLGEGYLSTKVPETIMYGLPRVVGIAMTNRIGLDNMFLFGSPKEAKAENVKSWLFDTAAGAPGGVLSDGAKAIALTVSGEYGKAATSLPFPKIMKDTLKAIEGYSQGKVSATGKPLAKPLTAPEAALKAFGLQPASEARQFEAGGSGREFKENKSAQAKASAMRNDWVKAKPGPERNAQWQKIQNWNARNPDNKVTMESLRKLEQRRKRDNAEAARDLNDE